MENLAKQLITYFKSLGIQVYTNTKARGHQGFYVKNRIDISKNTKEERVIPTLLHEFAHYIHEKLEKGIAKTGGTLEALFCATHIALIEKELIAVTNFVDENSQCKKLTQHKQLLKDKIKKQESIIKIYYPNFMRSKKFKEFDKFIRKSKAKHLLRYDRVKFVSRFLRHIEILSIDNLELDFPEMPTAYCAYIRLKSLQRKQARNSRRINQLNKYYAKPTELFARLVEGLYLDSERTKTVAPLACERFFELLEKGYYFELQDVFELLQAQRAVAIF